MEEDVNEFEEEVGEVGDEEAADEAEVGEDVEEEAHTSQPNSATTMAATAPPWVCLFFLDDTPYRYRTEATANLDLHKSAHTF